ncbi:MAG: endopeptidase La [Alphaproteobacteria bacterium CG11_big_fil_rev_8_21_14_0_20_44_7]|nr:MAG: endopeptidase La [Alphaproteobacteria bacterium CG11_big_fil_rev_8_21_14_0_20_44_7]
MFKKPQKEKYPVLYLRDMVIFPNMIAPLRVGREKSVASLEKALAGNRKILLLTQKDLDLDDPKQDDLYEVGVIGNVLQLLRLPDGNIKGLIEGEMRVRVKEFSTDTKDKCSYAEVEVLEEESFDSKDAQTLMRLAVKQFGDYLKLNRKIPPEMLTESGKITEVGKLADSLAGYLTVKISDKQKLLEELNPKARLEQVSKLIELEIEHLNAETKIRGRVKSQIEKNQKDYYLNEQLKAIQKELDEQEGKDELQELEEKIKTLSLSEEAYEKSFSELRKLKSMSPLSAEASVIRNYLDWIVSIPWKNNSKVKNDILQAQEVLEDDHFGLEQVKERILEYLAVQSRTNKMRGPILCLVGPPGVGKTSLGQSIAKATGREFAKIALGGMRDEAEIRGHRRTYLGSMPGKIIQSMKKTKHSNPLLMLDEIDKMSHDFRGDPSSALLEVLDPEQNNKFNDHYMEIDYDLSDVMFIATANSLNLPRPLLDRMEIIRISGYTEDEKVEIAKRHLLPKLLESHGLEEGEWAITNDAILELIRYYTREAGVRNLERELANLIRKAVKEIVSKEKKTVKVTRKNLEKYAKIRKYSFGQTETEDLIGITTGLAYTDTGGDILQIEAVSAPGKGKFAYTGNLKKVMEESIQAAASFVRSRCIDFGIKPTDFHRKDIHVHVPEGATPKDGPSAGVAMVTSIVSVLTGNPVKKNLAMTGEITLRGRVLPIGGLKEKLLAALRSGIKTVLIPKDNVKDLADIPDNVKNNLEIIPVSTADEVLKHALVKKLIPIEWIDDDIAPTTSSVDEDDEDNQGLRITH